MKNYQKNSRNPSVPFSCMLEQLIAAVQHKSIKWHLNNHIWSLNLNLVFKPTSFNLLLVALAQNTFILPCHSMHHIVAYCHVLLMFGVTSVVGSASEDIHEYPTEGQYPVTTPSGKQPLIIPIQPMFPLLLLFTALRQHDSNCCVLRQLNPYPLHDLSLPQ